MAASIPIRVALPFGSYEESRREPYRQALAAAGIGFDEDARSLDGLAGLLLAGGPDIDPERYDEPRAPETQGPDTARDALELALATEALRRDLPVLAICRGLQMWNVALGGTLTQHVDGHRQDGLSDAHPVQLEPGSRLAGIIGAREYTVNSRHHQAAGRIAEGLVVSARAQDGVVEALERPGTRFMLAVQWHPEDRTERDGALFRAFAQALAGAARP
jgi:putative glutamine amidotransferase